MEPLETGKMTWAVLVGRWMAFAQSAVALPDTAEGRAWKEAVPSIITLQALYFALKDSEGLDREQLHVGYDRASVQMNEQIGKLKGLFEGESLHPMLTDLIEDVQGALAEVKARLEGEGEGNGEGAGEVGEG